MPVTNVNSQIVVTLLDGSTTYMQVDEELNIAAQESFGGTPMRLPGGTSLLNMKLGLLSGVKKLLVVGDVGVSFRYEETGSDIPAHPFAYLANVVTGGMGVSELWLSNSDNEEHIVTVMAVE